MTITDVCPQKNSDSRVSVFLDGEYAFSLDEVDALVMGIKKGRELDENLLEKCRFLSSAAKAKEKALAFVARKPATRKMVRDMLLSKGFDVDAADCACDELEEFGYIDDSNYALLFLEYAEQKMWGERKVRYELAQKGVSKEIIEDAIAQMPQTDTNTLAEAMAEKYRGSDFADIRTKQRVQRYFVSRGFDWSAVNSALAICIQQQRNDNLND